MSDDVDGYDYMPMKNNGDFNDNIDENKTIISNNFMTHVLEPFFEQFCPFHDLSLVCKVYQRKEVSSKNKKTRIDKDLSLPLHLFISL